MIKRRMAHWKFLLLIVAVLSLSAALTWLFADYLPFGRQRVFHRAASLIGICGIYAMWRYVDRRSLAALGLGSWHTAVADGLMGARLGALTLLGLMAVLWWCGAWRVRLNPNHQQLWWAVGSFVPAAVVIGGIEELVFRGYVLQTLRAEYRTATAVAFTSAAYALAHFVKPPTLWPSMWPDFIGLFLFGVVLAVAALRTHLLYLSIGLHASLVYLVKVQKHLIDFDGGSPRWLFGNDRLLTGALGWVALGLLGWWVWRATRSRAAHGR